MGSNSSDFSIFWPSVNCRWCLEHGGEALSNLPEKDAETIRWASNKIAKIMMVSWGRYNKERFEKVESSAE